MIARHWRGWVRSAEAADYVAYISATGLREYASTPGNLGAWMLTRDLPEGRTEVVTWSLWESMEAVRRFAGEDPEAAVFYPEDERFLLAAETWVTHYEVAAHIAAGARPATGATPPSAQ